MSVEWTWIKCADGLWYADPVWRGYAASGERAWFLVLDDSDPAELVVRDDCETPALEWFSPRRGNPRVQSRDFGGKLRRSRCYFGVIVDTPPVPTAFAARTAMMSDNTACYVTVASGNDSSYCKTLD